MRETFRQERRLAIASRVNKFWYMLRKIPLIGKKIPAGVYEADGWKRFARIYTAIREVFGKFFGAAFYLAAFIGGPAFLIGYVIREGGVPDAVRCAQWVFLFMTVSGALIYTDVFDASEEKYYAIILMRVKPKESALSTLVFMLISRGLPMALFLTGAALLFPDRFSPLSAVCAAVFWLSAKVIGAAGSLKLTLLPDENKNGPRVKTAILLGSLACAVGLPFLGVPAPAWLWPVLAGVSLAAGVFCLRYLLRCEEYAAAYKQILKREACFPEATDASSLQAESVEKSIGQTEENRSAFHGIAGLHKLFVKRHRKILWKRSLILAGILAVLAAALLAFVAFAKPENLPLSRILMTLPFLMYLINQGQNVAATLFINCDQALLRYGFFRKRRVILSLFGYRLASLTLMNLLPAAVVAVALPGVQVLSGGQPDARMLAFTALCPLAMSLFFSVHRLSMYYLLQPYTDTRQIRSPLYKAVDTITYAVCLFFLNTGDDVSVSAESLGTGYLVFSLAYVAIALVLVWWRAPKTFRVRA